MPRQGGGTGADSNQRKTKAVKKLLKPTFALPLAKNKLTRLRFWLNILFIGMRIGCHFLCLDTKKVAKEKSRL